MEKGKNVRAVFDRFAGLVKAVEGACKEAGRGLEISEKYGNILSCPSNCGTGLRASMMIKIPLASKQENFKPWLAERKLQARGSGGFASKAADDGIRDVSNVDRMGKDEVRPSHCRPRHFGTTVLSSVQMCSRSLGCVRR